MSKQTSAFKIKIYITPKSSIELITLSKSRGLHLFVNSPPENNKANKQVIQILANWLHIPKTTIRITSGKKSREKIIELPKEYEIIYKTKFNELMDEHNKE